jgi:FkbM family methyltransferase
METMVCKYLDKSCKAMYDIGVGPKSEYTNIQLMMPWIKLYGCEPNPICYEKIKSKFHGLLLNCAIHSEKKKLELFTCGDDKQASAFAIPKATQSTLVPAMTLDEFDLECGSPEGILLWADIEGSELDMLRSGPNLLSSGRVHAINLEVRKDTRGVEGWCTADEVKAYLKTVGYIPVKKYNNQRSHWDLIFMPKERVSG